MINCTNAGTDKLQLITDAAADVDVHASWVDQSGSTITPDRTNTNGINTATTTDIVATPAASTVRNVKTLNIRNTHASVTVVVTVVYNANGTQNELFKTTLLAGEVLTYVEGIGWFKYGNSAKLDVWKRVTANSVHATAATFANITDLDYPLLSGKKYAVQACLFHTNNASTTGSQFGYNIGAAPTSAQFGNYSAVTNSVTAGVMSTGVITARDTAITAQTTGQTASGITLIGGFIQPSADGTFALRATSEITVANGLTVLAGSWMHIRELDN